jgi:hypothetical protein
MLAGDEAQRQADEFLVMFRKENPRAEKFDNTETRASANKAD